MATIPGVAGQRPVAEMASWDHHVDVAALAHMADRGCVQTATQPEVALLLRHLIDTRVSWSSKMEAVQMLLLARREHAVESVTLDQSLAAFYFELLSAAAEACSIVVETPSAVRGAAEAYSSLWRNALCGAVPEAIAQLELWLDSGVATSLRGERSAAPYVRVETALKALLLTSSDRLASCESAGIAPPPAAAANSGSSRIEDAAMFGSVVGIETPVHQPVRAWLLRSLIESALARPEAIADEFPDGHRLAEEVQSLSQSLRMDAQLEGLDIASSLENKVAAEDLQELLDKVCRDPGVHYAFAQQLLQQIHFWLESQDYESVSRCSKALASNLQALDTLTLYFDPAELVTMLASLLDRGDVGQLNDEPSTLCTIFLLCQLVCQRYGIAADAVAPAENQDSFFSRYLRSPAIVYRLNELPSDERALAGRWISALFDNEGISDDLTRGSSPRALLRLAPTLFSQSISACVAGVIDLEALRGGLSYFLQDLLSYSLPGAMSWILREVQRIPLSPLLGSSSTASEESIISTGLSRDATTRTVHLEVISLILDSEACPAAVRHAVAAEFELFATRPDLAKSLVGVESFDLDSIKSKMEGCGICSHELAKASVWLRRQLGPLAASRLLLKAEPVAMLRQLGAGTAASLVLQQLAANASAVSQRALSAVLVLASTGETKSEVHSSLAPIVSILQHIELDAPAHDAVVEAVGGVVCLSLILLRNLASVQTPPSNIDGMSDISSPRQTPAGNVVEQVGSLLTLKLARLSRSRPGSCRAFVAGLRSAKGETCEPALQALLMVLEVAGTFAGEDARELRGNAAVTV